ncbi:hypothetical protein PIB30_062470 [Stylosanthes scabra]|uniref:Putative plant transposon protein domain-containing protein n=1 Tax=Stylosanthes scabra TaxID=79078 RepID=A0ABU6XLI0_9FABA|nr:hypothetical protein [Stylosanthes scabra]
MVRGKDISFTPTDIARVLKLKKGPLPNVASYYDRHPNNLRIEEVQECLCVEGGEWVRHRDGRPHFLRRTDLDPMAKGWYEFVCRSIIPTTNRSEVTVERAVLIHSIIIGEDIRVEEIIVDQIYKAVYNTKLSSSLLFPSVIALLCLEAKAFIPGDTLIPQEAGINGSAMVRVREPRQPRQPRKPRREAPPQQEEEEAPQQTPQVHQQQDFPSSFYTHFDNSMTSIYRRLDNAQEENRRSFEALNTRMDRFDDQLSFLCYSNQMANEQMFALYQDTTRLMRDMEMQGIPVTMANLSIHRQKDKEMQQERARYDRILQEDAAEKAREENKGKARAMEVDSDNEEDSDEEESYEEDERCPLFLEGTIPTSPCYYLYDLVHLPRSERISPFFRIIATSLETQRELGRPEGLIRIWFPGTKILHLDSMKLRKETLNMEKSIFGLGFFIGAVAIRHGYDSGCTTTQLLAINDSDLYHSKLVRFYSRLGFREVYQVSGSLIGDIPHMLVYCGTKSTVEPSEWVFNGDIPQTSMCEISPIEDPLTSPIEDPLTWYTSLNPSLL